MESRPINSSTDMSLKRAALTAGFGLLLMVLTAPIAEMYILPKLIDYNNASQTWQRILSQRNLLVIGIFLYMITFIADVVVAWALYVFFSHHNKYISLLAAWFRLVYTAMALISLYSLLRVLDLTGGALKKNLFEQDDLPGLVMFHLRSFQQDWGFAFIFFGICLALLGYLSYKANYVPRFIGILLLIAGLGYIFSSLGPYFYPDLDTSFLMITYFGELVFMIWLLVKGWRLKTPA